MFERIKKIVYSISNAVGMIGNLCIVFNMVIVTVSIMMRVLFRSPILGLVDIVGLVSGCIVALTIAFTEKENGHVSASFIIAYFPKNVQIISHIIVSLLSNALLALLGWRLFIYARQAYIRGTASGTVDIPLYPFAFICSLGMFLFFLTFLVKSINRILHCEERAK